MRFRDWGFLLLGVGGGGMLTYFKEHIIFILSFLCIFFGVVFIAISYFRDYMEKKRLNKLSDFYKEGANLLGKGQTEAKNEEQISNWWVETDAWEKKVKNTMSIAEGASWEILGSYEPKIFPVSSPDLNY